MPLKISYYPLMLFDLWCPKSILPPQKNHSTLLSCINLGATIPLPSMYFVSRISIEAFATRL